MSTFTFDAPNFPIALYNAQQKNGKISLSSKLLGENSIFRLRIYSQKVTEFKVSIKFSLEWCQTHDGQILDKTQRDALNQSQYQFVCAKQNMEWAIGDLNKEQLDSIKFYASREAKGRAEFTANPENKGKTFSPKKRWAYVTPGKALGLKIDFSVLNAPAKAEGAKAAPNKYYSLVDLDINAISFQGIEEAAIACPNEVKGDLNEAAELDGLLSSVSISVESVAPSQTPTGAVAAGNPFLAGVK